MFVPPYPGEFLNPYPLGTTRSQGWWYTNPFELTINSATINATAEVEAVTDPSTGAAANGPPPAGDQYTLVNLTLTHKYGIGPTSLPEFLNNVWAVGANVLYKPNTCVPPPLDLGSIGTVDLGQTETGNLCFTIASTDATTLLLQGWYVDPPRHPGPLPDWFALHR
jgi:hypothetical protein